MAKKSIVSRNTKRQALFDKFFQTRKGLKKLIKKSRVCEQHKKECIKNVMKLDQISRNSSITRIRNRCLITGRARGLVAYKVFGLCGFQLREKANLGNIPGIVKK